MRELTFHDKKVTAYPAENCDWVRGITIFYTLGTANPKQSLAAFCKQHGDELEEIGAICRMRIKTNGGFQNCIMLNRQGAYIAGMVSRTEKAKEFRKWVLDVLEDKSNQKEANNKLRLLASAGEMQKEIDTAHAWLNELNAMVERSKEFSLTDQRAQLIDFCSQRIDIQHREMQRTKFALEYQVNKLN